MEALRQDVDEEALDKLTCGERHDFVARSAVATIILVTEGDAVLVEGRSVGDWRWRHGGYSATDRQEPPRVRRAGALRRHTTCACAAARGSVRTSWVWRDGHTG